MRSRTRMMKHCEILANIFLKFQATWFREVAVLRGSRVSLLGSKDKQVMKNFCSPKPVKSVLAQYICEFMILDAWHWNKCKYETVSKVAKDELNRKITLVQSRSTPQAGWSSSCREGKREPTSDGTDSMGVHRLHWRGFHKTKSVKLFDCPAHELLKTAFKTYNISLLWPI